MRIRCNNIVTECAIYAETRNKYGKLVCILSCVCSIFYALEIYVCMGDSMDGVDGQRYSNIDIF